MSKGAISCAAGGLSPQKTGTFSGSGCTIAKSVPDGEMDGHLSSDTLEVMPRMTATIQCNSFDET